MDNTEIYYDSARNFLKRYRIDASNHIVDIIVSVMRKRDDNNWMCGSFVEAVVSNNLERAALGADNDCVNHLKTFVLALRNCYIQSELTFYKVEENEVPV
jgi:hypothetical protein